MCEEVLGRATLVVMEKSSELLMVFVVVSSTNDNNHVHCNNECNENFCNELMISCDFDDCGKWARA